MAPSQTKSNTIAVRMDEVKDSSCGDSFAERNKKLPRALSFPRTHLCTTHTLITCTPQYQKGVSKLLDMPSSEKTQYYDEAVKKVKLPDGTFDPDWHWGKLDIRDTRLIEC